MHLRRKTTPVSFGSLYQFDPVMAGGILFDYFLGTVGRTITNDDPLGWANVLRDYRLDGVFYVCFFIPRRRNQYI